MLLVIPTPRVSVHGLRRAHHTAGRVRCLRFVCAFRFSRMTLLSDGKWSASRKKNWPKTAKQINKQKGIGNDVRFAQSSRNISNEVHSYIAYAPSGVIFAVDWRHQWTPVIIHLCYFVVQIAVPVILLTPRVLLWFLASHMSGCFPRIL